LIEVFHDNSPVFSSDSRVWECGIILARSGKDNLIKRANGNLSHKTPSLQISDVCLESTS